MQDSDSQLDDFEKWNLDRGRTTETAHGYRLDVASCLKERSPHRRLLDDSLSPKRRRRLLAAMRSWCKFTRDDDLRERLEDLRLPAPTRATDKVPLEADDWISFVEAVYAWRGNVVVKSVILIMCDRGLRVSDVLRMTHEQLDDALERDVFVLTTKGGRRVRFSTKVVREHLQVIDRASRKIGWNRLAEVVSPRAKNPMTAARLRVWRAVRRISYDLALRDMHPHRLRRTYAVDFLRELKGDPEALVKLQNHMGWADLNTAAGYVDHSRLEELDEVSARMAERRRKKKGKRQKR